jgi:hypothetical protein
MTGHPIFRRGKSSSHRRRRWLAAISALALTISLAVLTAPTALGDARGSTDTFTFTDHFVIEPGDAASCSFPITADQVGRGTFQVLRDASGTPIRVVVHNVWVGTLQANGKTDVEHAAQTNTLNLVDGTFTNVGSIHDQSFGEGS